jgi:xanthine dehydrogenase YagS FAD-binding subunit
MSRAGRTAVHEFEYIQAFSAHEAVQAMAQMNGRQQRYLAGGTTLVDLMKLGVERPSHLIDLTTIPELSEIDVSDPKELSFGALAHMSDVAEHSVVREQYPALSEALWKAASQQLRNMATLGGNLLQRTRCAYFRDIHTPCNKRSPGSGCSALEGINRGHAILGVSNSCIAVYPGDWAIALAAFDAVIDTQSPRGRRSIPILDFHRAPGTTPEIETALASDELIVRVRVPALKFGRASTYQKIRDRESYAFALTSAAVAIDLVDGIVRDVRIALGGVGTKPWRAAESERILIGQALTESNARSAAEAAFKDARTTPLNAFKVPLGVSTVVEALMIAGQRTTA